LDPDEEAYCPQILFGGRALQVPDGPEEVSRFQIGQAERGADR
jgi:hypothetical protein